MCVPCMLCSRTGETPLTDSGFEAQTQHKCPLTQDGEETGLENQ